jgi:hypothetical protein
LSETMSLWFMRRWNSYVVASNCAWSLALAVFLGLYWFSSSQFSDLLVKVFGNDATGIRLDYLRNCPWWFLNGSFFLVLLLFARINRCENKRMFEFLAKSKSPCRPSANKCEEVLSGQASPTSVNAKHTSEIRPKTCRRTTPDGS